MAGKKRSTRADDLYGVEVVFDKGDPVVVARGLSRSAAVRELRKHAPDWEGHRSVRMIRLLRYNRVSGERV